jgi:hypothetical protein
MSGYAAIIFDEDECTPSSVWYGTEDDVCAWVEEACAAGKSAFVARITDERRPQISQQEADAQAWRLQCLTDTLMGARTRH